MKKNYTWIIFLIVICLFQSCIDKIVVADMGKPQGKIIIQSEPQGAEIYLQGTKTDKVTPDSIIQLASGEYDITLKKESYRDTTLQITVYDSLTTSKMVVLQSIFETGSIYLESEPVGAEIFLDTLKTNNLTPDTLKNIIVGDHQVTLKKENYRDTSITVSVNAKETTSKLVIMTGLVKTGSISIQSNPAGAQIFLDSINTNKITPDTIKNIVAGNHTVTLKKNKYLDTTISVAIAENKTISKSVILSSAEKRGNIYIVSNPAGAQIYLDSISTGKITPDTLKSIVAGEHKITLKKNNYVDTSLIINVQENQTISKSVTLSPIIIRGNIYLESQPGGAQIFIDNNNTQKVTPDTLFNYPAGIHGITLKKNQFRDTTFQINVIGYLTVSKKVTLASIYGSIYIQSNPSGAGIYLGDKSTGKTTPDTIKNLVAGTYKITLKYPDYNDTSFYADVYQNTLTSKNVTLVRMIERGDLFIQSSPSRASIYLDNNNTGKNTPDTIKGLIAGDHKVALKSTGYLDTSLTVNIQKNSVTSKNVTLTEKLPVQTDTLYYGFILLGQTKFTFSFNQDITLDKVDIIEPGSTDKNSFDFGGEAVSKGSTRNIYYPKYLTGEWQLIFYGKKADTGSSFTLNKVLTIP